MLEAQRLDHLRSQLLQVGLGQVDQVGDRDQEVGAAGLGGLVDARPPALGLGLGRLPAWPVGGSVEAVELEAMVG
jgi:hypothetical protein